MELVGWLVAWLVGCLLAHLLACSCTCLLACNLVALAWHELAGPVLDLLSFLLALLDFILLRFAYFICLVCVVSLPVLLWFAFYACFV